MHKSVCIIITCQVKMKGDRDGKSVKISATRNGL